MNMLNNKTPFGLLSEEEQEIVKSCKGSLKYYFARGWHDYNGGELNLSDTHRLKLKVGEWYKYGDAIVQLTDKDGMEALCWEDGTLHVYVKNIRNSPTFRPATQSEIESVNPQKTFVDCKIHWKSTEAGVTPPFNENDRYDLSEFTIGAPRGGWVLSGYEYSNGFISNMPMIFNTNSTEIEQKAVNARFVKIN